jgi:holo-[acyl-carrier protein] synthase
MMLYGIGIDIVDVGRIEQAVRRWGERFCRRVYTDVEIEYCFARAYPYYSLAVRFAAKEAFIKAMGSGVPFPLTDIEVVNDEKGRPALRLYGKAEEVFINSLSDGRIHISLSHDRGCGIASVVIEKIR